MPTLNEEIRGCTGCGLCGARTQAVPGEGYLPARVLFVGEAPGQEEDLRGLPFVGKSGQLLRKMIEFLGFESYFFTNIVKCRPPENRNPTPDEIKACRGFLDRQLIEIQPKVVVAVGKFAAQTLLEVEISTTALREGVYRLPGASTLVVPVFHPSYVLRTPSQMGKLLSDLRKARILEEKLK